MFKIIDNVKVWGVPLENAVEQAANCLKDAEEVCLMADHHLGYAVPIGGVVAYADKVSPSGVGFDIACGNKAVCLDMPGRGAQDHIKVIMDDVWNTFSFGMGLNNKEEVYDPLFDEPIWNEIPFLAGLKDKARAQLGTIGSGNHYVDIFVDELNRVWVGVHFGSRGLGHKIATHYLELAGGKDGMMVDAAVLDTTKHLGVEYIEAMQLAGRYAYAGRDWVCGKMASMLGADIIEEVHNHHNFAWLETHHGEKLWVVRKGATPAYPGQRGFIGASMGENAVIVAGVDSPESKQALYSTVHGAGRAMSRSQAAGKFKRKKVDGRWVKIQKSPGAISKDDMDLWVNNKGVELRGGGLDEAPQAYKRLHEVLAFHRDTVEVQHTLRPIGVAMAGEGS